MRIEPNFFIVRKTQGTASLLISFTQYVTSEDTVKLGVVEELMTGTIKGPE